MTNILEMDDPSYTMQRVTNFLRLLDPDQAPLVPSYFRHEWMKPVLNKQETHAIKPLIKQLLDNIKGAEDDSDLKRILEHHPNQILLWKINMIYELKEEQVQRSHQWHRQDLLFNANLIDIEFDERDQIEQEAASDLAIDRMIYASYKNILQKLGYSDPKDKIVVALKYDFYTAENYQDWEPDEEDQALIESSPWAELPLEKTFYDFRHLSLIARELLEDLNDYTPSNDPESFQEFLRYSPDHQAFITSFLLDSLGYEFVMRNQINMIFEASLHQRGMNTVTIPNYAYPPGVTSSDPSAIILYRVETLKKYHEETIREMENEVYYLSKETLEEWVSTGQPLLALSEILKIRDKFTEDGDKVWKLDIHDEQMDHLDYLYNAIHSISPEWACRQIEKELLNNFGVNSETWDKKNSDDSAFGVNARFVPPEDMTGEDDQEFIDGEEEYWNSLLKSEEYDPSKDKADEENLKGSTWDPEKDEEDDEFADDEEFYAENEDGEFEEWDDADELADKLLNGERLTFDDLDHDYIVDNALHVQHITDVFVRSYFILIEATEGNGQLGTKIMRIFDELREGIQKQYGRKHPSTKIFFDQTERLLEIEQEHYDRLTAAQHKPTRRSPSKKKRRKNRRTDGLRPE